MPNRYSRSSRSKQPTKKEQGELGALDKKQSSLEQELEQEITEEREREVNDELQLVTERRAEIEQAREVDDTDARAKAGVLVVLGHDGAVHVERGLVRAEDRKVRRAERSDGEPNTNSSEAKAEKPEFSDALTRRLTAERSLALRASLATQPVHALTALTHALVLAAFYDDRSTALDIAVRDEAHLQRAGGKFDETKASQALHVLRTELQAALPNDAADLWVWMVEQNQATQVKYLAYCIAPSVNAMQDRASCTHTYTQRPIAASHSLAALLGLDMADWWQATSENYFGSVSKAKLIEAVRDTKGDEESARLEKMKKGDAVAAAATALDGTRWLPSLLRQK
jgi:ParB family chromosome partitioning protein